MKTTIARAVGSSFAIVAILTFFEYRTASAALFYLLYPGSALSLLMTGGHGGTQFGNALALMAGLIVNTLVYTVLGVGLLVIRGRSASQ
jgi:hypothetical protein